MPLRWTDLESAFFTSDHGHDARAWVHGQTGEVRVCILGQGDGPPPDHEVGWLLMPDARELDLSQRLVWRFVADECPLLQDEVHRCFSGRGAWSAFKGLMSRGGLLDSWYRYRDDATRHTLLDWAADHGITVIDVPADGEEPGTSG